MPEVLGYLGVVLAVTLIGLTKSGFGAGVGLMIVPLTAVSLAATSEGEETALGLLLPLLILGDLLAIGQHAKHFDWGVLKRLLPATAVGVVLGGLVLWWIKAQADLVAALIRIEIGLECLLLVGLHWWRQARGQQTKLLPEPLRSWLSGTFIAVSSTLAHAAGPIFAMYLLPLNKPRHVFVGTSALYFFLLNNAKLPAYVAAGQFSNLAWMDLLLLAPLVGAGAILGYLLKRHLTDAAFTHLIYQITFALGGYVLYTGVAALLP